MSEAKRAAGDKNVLVHGAAVAQLALAAGVLDELEIHVVPVLFGQGRRLFDNLDPEQIELERTRILEGGRCHPHALPRPALNAGQASCLNHARRSIWPACAQDSSCRSSIRSPTPRSPRSCPPRRRRRAGTESSSGTTCGTPGASARGGRPVGHPRGGARVTERLRLGPMVTPLARRRPVKVARETATLDLLSGGRLTLGVGLGSDRFGTEYSVTGEDDDDRRARRCSTRPWRSSPRPGQASRCTTAASTTRSTACVPAPAGAAPRRPGVGRGFHGKPRPMRRAARYEGFVPVNLEHPDQLAEFVACLGARQRGLQAPRRSR